MYSLRVWFKFPIIFYSEEGGSETPNGMMSGIVGAAKKQTNRRSSANKRLAHAPRHKLAALDRVNTPQVDYEVSSESVCLIA